MRLADKRAELDGWEQPVPLGSGSPPPFPVSALPPTLRAWVQAEATATQTPPDLAAAMALASLAAAASKRFEVEVLPGWREPLNLYCAVSLPPGNRKSAVVRDATAPLLGFEHEEAERLRASVDAARHKLDIRREAHKRAMKRAAGSDDPAEMQEAIELGVQLDETELPVVPRLVADDVTPEQLTALMAAHGGRMAIISAEGGIFEIIAGRYSDSPNLEVFLKGHCGDDLRVDRVGRAPSHIPAPALTLGLAVQPEVVSGLASKPTFRGRGLLARVLFFMPESMVGHRLFDVPQVPDGVLDDYRELFRSLLRVPLDREGPKRMTAAHGAVSELRAFADDIEAKMAPGGSLAPMADWASKAVGATARLAGLFHLAGPTAGTSECSERSEIGVETMRSAIVVGRYLLAHAAAAFAVMGADSATAGAQHLLAWVQSKDTRQFTKREAHQANRAMFQRAADLDPMLALLEAHGFLFRRPDVPTHGGRPRGPSYTVNPSALAQKPQKPQNPVSAPEGSRV
ncbi:MAG: DUF3987 domain-containing protein [Myxococcales bacterium]|nr:DUF3987 domain-containing protein [Myxococcales bacterium]